MSVAIAVKNEEKYVRSAITSVCEQKGIQHEVIVVDDGSTDSTYLQLQELKLKYPHLQVHKNPNPGKARAFNLAVAHATGDFICLFSGDDIMPEGSLSARYEVLQAAQAKNIAKGDSRFLVGLSKLKTMSQNPNFDGMVIPKEPWKGGFTGTSYLIQRGLCKKIFPIPESLPNEDSWTYLCIVYFKNVEIVHSDIISCFWRVHQGNSISHQSDFQTYSKAYAPRMEAYALFLQEYKTDLNPSKARQIEAIYKAELLRRRGKFLSILMLPGLSITDRLRAISSSTPFFYWLRKRFFHFFSGWG